MSYIICEECGRRYEIEEGYNPGSFPWKCECGGSLIYVQNSNTNINDELFL